MLTYRNSCQQMILKVLATNRTSSNALHSSTNCWQQMVPLLVLYIRAQNFSNKGNSLLTARFSFVEPIVNSNYPYHHLSSSDGCYRPLFPVTSDNADSIFWAGHVGRSMAPTVDAAASGASIAERAAMIVSSSQAGSAGKKQLL